MKVNKTFKKALIFITAAAGISGFAAGCDAAGGITIPSGATEITVSTKSDESILNPAPIVISEAKVMITTVEFEKESDGRNQLIQNGPFVVNLLTNGSLKDLTTNYMVRDLYTKVKFQVHKLEDNETSPDPEFINGSQRYSMIIKGTYNGSNFVYKSKKSSNIVLAFGNTVNINLKTMNVTTVFNPAGWFLSGSTTLNPSDPANENAIDNNIKISFKRAFLDNNKDGNPD
jgi:hypothetical protein